jgi:hypothetical protein
MPARENEHPNLRRKLICCEVFVREMCAAVARSRHTIDIEFLPKGLHDIGSDGMRARLQDVLDRVDEPLYDAILFGYGLCNNGIVGLEARGVPLVIPRAHDCITLFLGSHRRYLEYFRANPGTYFCTTGWIERGEAAGEYAQLAIGNQSGMNKTYEELVEEYGEDNAQFLHEQLTEWTRHYRQITYISMGLEGEGPFEEESRRRALEKRWEFDKVNGDMGMLTRLLDGNWSKGEFLVVPPGNRIAPSYDDCVIRAEPAPEKAP